MLRGGSGPPLIFLHGASGHVGWLPFLDRLSRSFDVIAPEHPGFGQSDDPAWLESVGDLACFYLDMMDALKLDAYVYPTWSNPPRLIGDLNTPGGDNSQFFSPTTGFPSIQVPMGYTRGVLPAGITFFGRPWSEATLIKLAYSYEQTTHHRRPPTSTPPLR